MQTRAEFRANITAQCHDIKEVARLCEKLHEFAGRSVDHSFLLDYIGDFPKRNTWASITFSLFPAPLGALIPRLSNRPLPPDGRSPLSLGIEWASRIFAVAVEMMLPAVAGYYLDQWWGTGFLAVVGFGLGFALGMFHLLAMTGTFRSPTKKP